MIGRLCRVSCFSLSNQMKILVINTHLTYAGWSENDLQKKVSEIEGRIALKELVDTFSILSDKKERLRTFE